MNTSIGEFPVVVYGKISKYNDVLSKARCRIFYKYGNRNGTYITDEFAEKLLSSLPYTPIKGIYDIEEEDFSDHGEKNSLGRIYGIVPQEPNIGWEKFIDEDGIEREYACTDVLLFTALYKEANDIVGKAQSMELFPPSLKYHNIIVNGQRYICFDEGCFFGLQVLGDTVEPCFEGSSFYTLQDSITKAMKAIEEYTNQGGQLKMPNINFKLSDREKFDAIWNLLNPDFNEEGNWTCTYFVSEVYDEYVLAFNYETQQYEKISYTKDDEKNLVELGEKVTVYVEWVTTEEKDTLETLRKLNGDTYELINENLVNAEKNAKLVEEFDTKIEDYDAKIATLTQRVDDTNHSLTEVQELYEEAKDNILTLSTENTDLKNFKLNIETQQKLAVIDEYNGKISEDILDSFKEKIQDYTVLDLDMQLAYELKKSNPSVFSKSSNPDYVPKQKQLTGVEAILSHYEK